MFLFVLTGNKYDDDDDDDDYHIFTTRDAYAYSAGYAVARCLSVHPSVTGRYSVETAKHIIKVFSPSGSQTILVFFHTKRDGSTPTGPPPNGASNARVV